MSQRSSPLHEAHASLGAKFTEFGGWEMPVEFDSIRTEHAAVREAAGKFDVSHMGELVVTGEEAGALCDRLTTNDISALDIGGAAYSLITDEQGIILDDTMVYRRDAAEYLVIPNAGHDEQMYDRWTSHRDEWGLDAEVENATESLAMIVLQGPDASDVLAPHTEEAVLELSHMEATWATVAGVETYAARTGYTGEDGFEFLYPVADASAIWEALDCQPCGLGARDTLRTEMGFLLSGQDFDPDTEPRNPYEADVAFAVDLDTEFVGRDALAAVAAAGPEQRFVGLSLTERGIPRHGYVISDLEGSEIGHVTSGTMSPTLGESIGLGYVDVDHAEPGTEVRVVIRDDPKTAKIRDTPFRP